MTTNAATKARASKTTQRPVSRQESATKAEEARLIELVNAVKEGMGRTETANTKHTEVLSLAEQAALTLGNSRVATARAIAALMSHPATHAKGGATKGQPSLSVVATLTGYPRNTLRPLWDGAQALIAKKWAGRTTPVTEQERALVGGYFKGESARKTEANRRNSDSKATKATTTKAAKGTVAPTLESIVESLSGVLAMVSTFTKDHGLTESQFDGLGKQLDLIHDALESAVANTVAAESDAE
jgi:hypothetical protein